MKNIIRFLSVVLVLVSIVSVVGCSSGSKSAGSVKDRVASILRVLPANVSGLTYTDIYTLRNDNNMSMEWASLLQGAEGNAILQKLNGLGMVDVEGVVLFVGDFSLAELMETAANGSYEYGGIKVETYDGDVSAAVVNGVAINSLSEYEMKRCIDVAQGKEPSMYGSEDLKAVLARVPDGYMMVAWVAGNETVPEGFDGLLAVAQAMTRQGSKDLQTTVYKFNSSDAAQQYIAIASNESQGVTLHFDWTQDGAFVMEVATPVTATPTPVATPVATVTPTTAP